MWFLSWLGRTEAGSTHRYSGRTSVSPGNRQQQTRSIHMKQVILITGASSGFGALAARALSHAGHIVYASMRDTQGRNAPQVKAVEEYAAANHVDIRAIELDVALQQSADEAIERIVTENGRLDVVIHN